MIKKKKTAKKNIAQLETEIEDLKTKYLRALADYNNLEKRTAVEIDQKIRQAKKNCLMGFLGVLDNIERAEIFVKDEGLRLVRDQFLRLLTTEGVKELDLIGKIYDPMASECVELLSGDQENIVVEVVQKGYAMNSDLIRPAKVKVVKKKL